MVKRRLNIILCALYSVAWLALFSATILPVDARYGDNRTIFVTSEDRSDLSVFYLTAKTAIEATAQLAFYRLENGIPSTPVPYDFLIGKTYDKKPFFTLRPKPGERMYYGYKFYFTFGAPSSQKTVDYVYSLPYASSMHCMVSQSYGGEFSHQKGSQAEYAVDFLMPEGTTVLAARPGKIIGYRDDSAVGGSTQDFIERENFLVVKHDDGTYAHYVHLKQKGVLVKLGQVVEKGTPIALSGNTGWSQSPHLHFVVCRVANAMRINSLPFQMQTSKGIVKRLLQGEVY